MQINSAKERLRKSRIKETVGEIEDMLKVLKTEQYKLLTNFMCLHLDDLQVYMDITQNGEYVLNIKAVSDKLIDVGRVL